MKNKVRRLVAFGIICLIIVSVNNRPLAAQQPNQWTPQQPIPYYGDESEAPNLVADSNNTVHAFNSQEVSGELVITYRQWSLERGWSAPIDILLPAEKGSARMMDAFLDHSGMIHLVFFSGNDVNANIYYSKAPVVHAGQAQAWSAPELIGEKARSPNMAALAGDDKGNLFVVYSGKPDGIGVYAVYSNDAGDTWSEPIPIFLTYSSQLFPSGLRMLLDQQGQLHAVWNVNNARGTGEVIYYTRLATDRLQWSQPIELAVVEGYSAAWASIIEHNNELFVIYQNSQPATRWMRKSSDWGETWTAPVRPWSHVGEYGNPVLLVDSHNVLHIILGNRAGACCHGMWHGVWLGKRWSELTPLVMGPKTLEFDPSAPQAVISQGNVLLATWRTDTGGAHRNGAWYSYAILDAPELPLVPLPTPIMPTPTPTPTPTPPSIISTPTTGSVVPEELLENQAESEIANRNPGTTLMIAIIPVVLLISIIAIAYHFALNNRH